MLPNSNAVFDSIVNSEDEMLKCVDLRKSQACIYLRAYIIVRLIFFRQFVISDSAVNLNRAFRTLLLTGEGEGHYDLSPLPSADFEWLVREGFIRFAARDIYKGNFSERLRVAQQNKIKVDLPSKEYSYLIGQIHKDENTYWWSLDEVSEMFTSKFKDELNNRLLRWDSVDSNKVKSTLSELSKSLVDEETITYNMVKAKLLKKCSEKSFEYQIVRDMLRRSYDYNVPEVLNLDYSRFFTSNDSLVSDIISPLSEEYEIPWSYAFNQYGFAAFPAKDLKDIWKTKEYSEYEKQMHLFREDKATIDSLWYSIEKYLKVINDHIVDSYNTKDNHNKFTTSHKLDDIRVLLHSFVSEGHPITVSFKLYEDLVKVSSLEKNPLLITVNSIMPSATRKVSGKIAKPPNYIKHAIIKVDKTKIHFKRKMIDEN